MAVKLRLTRVGSKKNPIYRVVAADSRSPRDGKFIEIVGRYNPQHDPSLIELDEEKVRGWLAQGRAADRVGGEAPQGPGHRSSRGRARSPSSRAGSSTSPTPCASRRSRSDDGTLVLQLHVAEADVGKVIGRQGRLARALRTIVRAGGVERGAPAPARDRRLTWRPVAALYDIHGNLAALEAVLAEVPDDATIVVGGDVCAGGEQPSETLERLRGARRPRRAGCAATPTASSTRTRTGSRRPSSSTRRARS